MKRYLLSIGSNGKAGVSDEKRFRDIFRELQPDPNFKITIHTDTGLTYEHKS